MARMPAETGAFNGKLVGAPALGAGLYIVWESTRQKEHGTSNPGGATSTRLPPVSLEQLHELVDRLVCPRLVLGGKPGTGAVTEMVAQ